MQDVDLLFGAETTVDYRRSSPTSPPSSQSSTAQCLLWTHSGNHNLPGPEGDLPDRHLLRRMHFRANCVTTSCKSCPNLKAPPNAAFLCVPKKEGKKKRERTRLRRPQRPGPLKDADPEMTHSNSLFSALPSLFGSDRQPHGTETYCNRQIRSAEKITGGDLPSNKGIVPV